MSDGSPKSAYELVMERLRKKDAEQGIQRVPLTDAQKAAIAEVRNFYEAKLAEMEVLWTSRRITMDPAALLSEDEEYRSERERLIAERDAKIEKIRSGAQ